MSEKSHGKRVKVPVDAKPKAPIWPPDAVVVPGVQDCSREQAGRVYNTVVRDTKMEIPVKKGTPLRTLTIFLVVAILFGGLPAGSLHAPAANGPHLQYVGAVAINPCQDPRVLADWYSKIGIETHESSGGFYGTFMTPAGPFFFGIHPKRKNAPKTSSSSVSVVFRVDDYDGYISEVRRRGLEPNGVEQDSEGRFAHFKDPDGNEVTLWGK